MTLALLTCNSRDVIFIGVVQAFHKKAPRTKAHSRPWLPLLLLVLLAHRHQRICVPTWKPLCNWSR